MAKFLTIWEVDDSYLPEDAEERLDIYVSLLNIVKSELESGHKVDWGVIVGGSVGYSVCEAESQELDLELMKFSPYIKFSVYPVLTVDQELENLQKITELIKD